MPTCLMALAVPDCVPHNPSFQRRPQWGQEEGRHNMLASSHTSFLTAVPNYVHDARGMRCAASRKREPPADTWRTQTSITSDRAMCLCTHGMQTAAHAPHTIASTHTHTIFTNTYVTLVNEAATHASIWRNGEWLYKLLVLACR